MSHDPPRETEAPYPLRASPLVLFATATALGVYAGWQHVRAMVMSVPDHVMSVPLAHGLAMRMPFWYLWAAFVPFLLWFARRVPLERMRWPATAALHVGLAVAVVLLHRALQLGVQLLLPRHLFSMGGPFPDSLGGFVADAFGSSLALYAILLGAVYSAAYYARFRERELAATRLQGQLAQAQLQALRMQLNPHFLFNALNSIAMLVRGGRSGEAVRMLAGLGDLLRGVLEEDPPAEVPLREELDFLRRYLEIERIRADRLEVRMEAEPETLEARVPTLILQPLVENAIRHGIARSRTAGLVEITARREGEALELAVRDDGPGFPAGDEREGVGLRNTRVRLARMYGVRQSLEIAEAEGGGARVTLRFPFRGGEAVASGVEEGERERLETAAGTR